MVTDILLPFFEITKSYQAIIMFLSIFYKVLPKILNYFFLGATLFYDKISNYIYKFKLIEHYNFYNNYYGFVITPNNEYFNLKE